MFKKLHVQCGWSSGGIGKVDGVGRGFLCQAEAVKGIPTLCRNLLNLCEEG